MSSPNTSSNGVNGQQHYQTLLDHRLSSLEIALRENTSATEASTRELAHLRSDLRFVMVVLIVSVVALAGSNLIIRWGSMNLSAGQVQQTQPMDD